jgi:putative oxidoreductase
MEELKLTVLEDQRGWIDHVRRWLPRLAVALLFFFVGKSKFGAQSRWIKTFEQIGFGQWFRYLTGAVQMAGAIAVLIPRIFLWCILLLAGTMLGAMAAWVFFLAAPFNAIFPGALLVGLLLVGGEDLISLVLNGKGLND